MIDYKTIDNFRQGIIEKLLKTSYENLIRCFPEEKQRFYRQWEKEDRDAFLNPEILGKYVLFSCLDHNPIGYFSWDDRQYPVGIVGQNCILPDYQGKGYGKKQIEKIMQIFQERKYTEIKAVTGDHDFFIPAHQMYTNCGFQEHRKMKGELFDRIEFLKRI